MKLRHDGRLKDRHQIPHRNRSIYLVKFWFELPNVKNKKGNFMGCKIAVSSPIEANLMKYKEEMIAANPEWIRPKYKQIFAGYDNGKEVWHTVPVYDPKTGKQIMENMLKKVTADFIGADI